MGVVVSMFGGNTGRTDDPDPVTGLTSRDRYLVTSSWAEVRKDPTGNGVALLMLFFEKYPDYVKLFPFRDIPMKDLPTNKRFQAHCNSVIYGLSAVIDLINNTDLLVAQLLKVGETHKPRGVTDQAYLDLKGVVIDLFSTFMTKSQIEAWKKTLDVAMATMIKGSNQ
ncbi:globin isoform X1 [Aethina tumida]|uniref:globin isoform X1 n=1 Tax=Aethina tumida TaxID=116153 RepID=UPI00096B2259|nr:globin isoform X1 [Aethina tumida]XP_049819889.1 globin isoform X1 [Aethina tumida]